MRANLTICLGSVLAAGLTAVLAGCASGTAARSQQSALAVRIAMYGGPMKPDGHMALDDAPAPNEPVTVTAADGRAWHTDTSADGSVTLQLPPGRYRVTSTYCGLPAQVRLVAGRPATAVLRCDVP